MPGCVLLGEVVEQPCFCQEVFDELSVEVCEAEEASNVSEVAKFQPVGNGGGFSLIYADTSISWRQGLDANIETDQKTKDKGEGGARQRGQQTPELRK